MESTTKHAPRPQFPSLCVYALHAGDLKYRYVGTSKNARGRITEHRSRARRGHAAPVYRWMREVGPENVQIVILESIMDATLLHVIEAEWIAGLIDLGFDLLNEDARDGVPFSKSERGLENLRIGQRSTPSIARPVTVNGTEYASISEAANATGVNRSTITKYRNLLGDAPLTFEPWRKGNNRLVV